MFHKQREGGHDTDIPCQCLEIPQDPFHKGGFQRTTFGVDSANGIRGRAMGVAYYSSLRVNKVEQCFQESVGRERLPQIVRRGNTGGCHYGS